MDSSTIFEISNRLMSQASPMRCPHLPCLELKGSFLANSDVADSLWRLQATRLNVLKKDQMRPYLVDQHVTADFVVVATPDGLPEAAIDEIKLFDSQLTYNL